MRRLLIGLLIVLIVLSSLCVKKDMRSITINNQTYAFNYNLFDIIKINVTDEEEIKSLIDESKRICIDFENSTQDSDYFAVGGFNLVFRITRFYYLEGEQKDVKVCKEEPKIFFVGPSTANETIVRLVNKTIIVEGTTPDKFEMAVDRLSLVVLGIDKERLEEIWLIKH